MVLQPVLLGSIAYLLIDRHFRLRTELARGFSVTDLAGICATYIPIAIAVAIYVNQVHPHLFFNLPRMRPDIWILIVCFYPVLSVIPQELVYRTFYFHRYGPLFAGRPWLAILTNAALFAFAHIIFGNWIASGWNLRCRPPDCPPLSPRPVHSGWLG